MAEDLPRPGTAGNSFEVAMRSIGCYVAPIRNVILAGVATGAALGIGAPLLLEQTGERLVQDAGGPRVLNETLGRLLGTAAPGAAVVHLGAERARRGLRRGEQARDTGEKRPLEICCNGFLREASYIDVLGERRAEHRRSGSACAMPRPLRRAGIPRRWYILRSTATRVSSVQAATAVWRLPSDPLRRTE
jgi:hypothetical protein